MQHAVLGRIEEKLAHLEGLIDALIFIGEHAEEEELPQARNCAMSLLYIAADNLRAAGRAVTAAQTIENRTLESDQPGRRT